MKSKAFLFALSLAAVLALAGCGESGGKSVTVNMREFNFSPESFTVEAGAEVTVTLKNLGALDHNFHIMRQGSEVAEAWDEGDEAGALVNHEEVPGGESATLTFTAPNEPGEYQFLCSVPAHFQQGMSGVMTVVGE